MAATYEELIAKSRELHASGDVDGARRVAEIAISRRTPERSIGQTIYENVIGSGDADTPGERMGQAINDAGKSFFAGVGRGAAGLLDLPGNIVSGAGNYAIDKAEDAYEATTGRESSAFDGARYAIDRFPMGDGSAARDISELVTDGGVNYRGESRGSRIAGTIGEFLPGAAALGGTNAILPYAVAPGVASEFAGEATEGKTIPENIPLVGGKDAEPFARIAAAIAAPAAYNVGTNAIRSAVTPHPTDPARIAAARRLESEGVQLTAGQKTGNRNLMYREDITPRTQGIGDAQGGQFTAAALRRIGVDGSKAEPEVMLAAYNRIGGMFDDLAARNNITPDGHLRSAVRAAANTYGQNTAKSNIAPIVRNIMEKIELAVRGRTPITGEQYQSWRSQLGAATKGTDGQLKAAATAIRGALDDAMERTLQASGNADDLALYSQARQQYRDFLAIERAAASAGEDTALGIINPRQLRQATTSQSRRGYVTGQNDLGELARAGNATMPPLPQSGTAPRIDARTISALQGSGTGAGLGGLTYLLTKDPSMTATAAIVGSLLPNARNAVAASNVGQRYLANQLMTSRDKVLSPEILATIAQALTQAKAPHEY